MSRRFGDNSVSERKKSRADKKKLSDWLNTLERQDSEMRGIWLAWERFCYDQGVDHEKAFSMGWSKADEIFKVGLAAAFLEIEPPEPSPEACDRAMELFNSYSERLEKY